ncbi:MAG: translesion error-prone DNA polymerase V autoproteolytic subunit [Leptolyngbyaceae cyanobacterium MO_188.B28]|nr:translesion error-prone DNA polymerase V autoproteolytic subunit [Leptolyngbyaceae cyanobacterium MO_188.B28]
MSGFPSPAEDYLANPLDLNHHIIKHPAATFVMRARGDLLMDSGIYDGDILVVDRSLTPTNGRIVIAAMEGQLTAKRLLIDRSGRQRLENPPNPSILVNEDVEVWGVVTHVIHHV